MTGLVDTVTEARWELHSALALGALPSAVPCARLHAKHVLWEWELGHLAETVELVVSEHAIKATEALPGPITPPVRLRLVSDRTSVVVEVWDGSTQPPVLAAANAAADGGRGLLLVDTLSSRWGWLFPHECGGKTVWAHVVAT